MLELTENTNAPGAEAPAVTTVESLRKELKAMQDRLNYITYENTQALKKQVQILEGEVQYLRGLINKSSQPTIKDPFE